MVPAFTSSCRITFLAAALSLALVAGCATAVLSAKTANEGILVFGAKFGSTGIPDDLAGVPAEETPCLRGRDLSFETQAVLIGYGHNGRIRKVITRNPGTSIFGIRPGDEFVDVKEKVLAIGFHETGTAHRYRGGCCLLTLFVDESGRVFGLTVELAD